MGSNRLVALPSSIAQLERLTRLDAGYNLLRRVPAVLCGGPGCRYGVRGCCGDRATMRVAIMYILYMYVWVRHGVM